MKTRPSLRKAAARLNGLGIMAVASGAMMLASCAATTPTARIKKFPQMYEALPAAQQELVRAGEIRKGFSEEAVLLAWGKPSQKTVGEYQGKPVRKWLYTAYETEWRNGIGMGLGFGSFNFGRHGRRYLSSYYGLGPQLDYVRVASAWVRFMNGRVYDWERAER